MGRVQTLAHRVGWLDRNRRALSIVIAIAMCPLVLARMSDILGTEWPPIHSTLLAVMIGVGLWAVVEVMLVWITALWETECAQLLRENGLPRAVARPARRTWFRKQ